MSCCKQELLSLCSIPKVLNRDGYGGANAKIYLPFAGFAFASGAQFTPTRQTVRQYKSRTIGGISKPNTFTKGYTCSCGSCA